MKLSIIIPLFNEEKTIAETLMRVDGLDISNWEKEVIIVNDGSEDLSGQIVKRQKLKTKSTFVYEHKKNLGKGSAVKTGIEKASGDFIIIQDADLEYNPAQIRKLVRPIEEKKAVVVYGSRLDRLPHFSKEERRPLFVLHFFGNRFLSLITSLLFGQWITDMETCYKLFPRRALKTIQIHSKSFDFEAEITAKLLKAGYTIVEIPITTTPRGYNEGKKLHTVRDGIIALYTLVKYRFVN